MTVLETQGLAAKRAARALAVAGTARKNAALEAAARAIEARQGEILAANAADLEAARAAGLRPALLDRLALGGDGTAGIALCNVAGVTTAVPAMAAQLMPQYAAGAAAATAQLAMAAVLTAILSPLLVRRYARRREKSGV